MPILNDNKIKVKMKLSNGVLTFDGEPPVYKWSKWKITKDVLYAIFILSILPEIYQMNQVFFGVVITCIVFNVIGTIMFYDANDWKVRYGNRVWK